MKQIAVFIAIVIWTLLCIYGTYNNTVKNAEVTQVDGGYEITYWNTGEVHFYE